MAWHGASQTYSRIYLYYGGVLSIQSSSSSIRYAYSGRHAEGKARKSENQKTREPSEESYSNPTQRKATQRLKESSYALRSRFDPHWPCTAPMLVGLSHASRLLALSYCHWPPASHRRPASNSNLAQKKRVDATPHLRLPSYSLGIFIHRASSVLCFVLIFGLVGWITYSESTRHLCNSSCLLRLRLFYYLHQSLTVWCYADTVEPRGCPASRCCEELLKVEGERWMSVIGLLYLTYFILHHLWVSFLFVLRYLRRTSREGEV